MKEFKEIPVKLRTEIGYTKEDAETIYNTAVHVVKEYKKKYNYRSIYMIGSYATRAFSPNRSDCDLVAFYDGDEVLFEEKSVPVILLNKTIKRDMTFSVCSRPISFLPDYWNILMSRLNSGVIWKEFNAVEDYMMIHDHGILIDGEEIRNIIPDLSVQQYFEYINLRSRIIVSIGEHDKMGVLGLAKAVIANTRDSIYLWTGKYCYETYECFNRLKELTDFPKEALDIFEETVKAVDIDWDKIEAADNVEVQLMKYLRKCKKYFKYLKGYENSGLPLKYPHMNEVIDMYPFIPYNLPTLGFNKTIQVSVKENNTLSVVINDGE